MNQEELQRTLEALGKGGIQVNGDFVVSKHVEYEVNNVEAGGIGIQFNNSNMNAPQTNTEKSIKTAIEALLSKKDAGGEFVFKNKKQWWAVYRVLAAFCNYPVKMTAFVKKIVDLELDYADNPTVITYDSLSAAPKDVPQMACSPDAWDSLKDISENYKQQFEVANFLMLKLGIKTVK